MYIQYESWKFIWSEGKRALNLKHHGIDFLDAAAVFEGPTVTVGLLAGVPVSIVHTETEHEIRVISCRKATRREAQRFSDAIKN